MDGYDLVLLRGSLKFEDWVRDLMAIANPFTHSQLGPVHPGFLLGMPEAWAEIKAKSKGPFAIAGHSLGAARAAILAGLMSIEGLRPSKMFLFGSPKAGFAPLAERVRGLECESFRNGNALHHDLVTDVPVSCRAEEYVEPFPLTTVIAPPASGDSWGFFAWHHLELYRQAVAHATG
jgi:hypothetical protein